MQAKITVRFRGKDKVLATLKRLEQVADSPEVRKHLGRIAQRYVVTGRSNLWTRSKGYSKGRLWRSLVDRMVRKEPAALAGFLRSSASNRARGVPVGNHAHLVDRGTKRRQTKQGKNRGRMPANHFWRDATVEVAKHTPRLIDASLTQAYTNAFNQ